ncbi:hypothetical protein KUTeg_024868 [Tegillarca granosa]|uniref:Uncharacterized protein n=1 Tax=Tegillarca granosa TaxID=220873 RepID=A0ABQ9E393_TEGGR|nr:hypothetical protein KUTeg_024868 [Tegillarca granosa]
MSAVAKAGKKIVYPAGCKEISEDLGKDELVKRLKLLARAFQDMGQDDNEQYSGLAIHLATDFFLDHQNKDVRLLVACCLADVFRIFAPEAPFREPAQLKEIFMFLIKQLRGLEDPDSPTFKRYFYLLENLAWVKSFNICIELEDNQEIFCSLFQLMFSIVNEKHSSKVRNFMLDMMTPLITEADAVSQELLDIILQNIIEPHKTQRRVPYQLAKDLLIRTSNAIEPYIQAFFNNALMLGKMSESEVGDRLYDLIYELNQISPSVLLAVLPQLEFKLKSNEESERKAVTKLLAKMFSDPGSNLIEQNKPLWNCFIGRFNDISIPVRQTCVSYAQHFLMNHPDTMKDIVEQLKSRQHDPEETVRMEVVNTILNIAKKDFSRVTNELLGFIKERTLDKKFQIRREALLGLGNLFKTCIYSERVEKSNIEKINWVKDKVFHHYYQHSNEDRLLVERVFNTCLVPYNSPVEERMRRLLLLYSTLDDNAVKAFHEMLKHRNNVRKLVTNLVSAIEQSSQGNAVSVNPRIAAIARTLPETGKCTDHLKKFCHMLKDDKRIRQFLKILVSDECTSKRAQDLVREILKKLGGPAPGQQNHFYNTIKFLCERIAPVMIDSTAIDMLVKHVDETVQGLGIITEGIDNAGEKGVRLLLALSAVYPFYFKSEEMFETLLTFLRHDDECVSDLTLQIFINTGQDLQTEFPNIYSTLMPILQSTAKIGNPKQSKHAIRCINTVCKNKEAIFAQIFEGEKYIYIGLPETTFFDKLHLFQTKNYYILTHLKKSLNPDSANYITAIVALGHISYLCPEEFSAEMKTIVSKTIVKDLLMQDKTSGPDTLESWYSEHHVTEETMAKLQAMKLLVRWLMGLKSNVNNSGTSTIRLLYTVIIHEGDLMEKNCINKPELARLRLQAGCCMLKLAQEKVYAELITREQFQALALLINDSCYYVRLNFSLKLNKGLLSLRLPLEYMSIYSLAANDPLRERRAQLKQFLHNNVTKRREYLKTNPMIGGKFYHFMPDYVMPYVIHLLAHDPDLRTHYQVDALKNIKECLWFIMEPLISKNEDFNYAFFRRMLENIKQTKDAQAPDDEEMNKKLYAVCDVALSILASKSSNITLKDSKNEPVLPAKLFTKIDRKKGAHGLSDASGKAGGTGKSGANNVETIIVESPGPVVNTAPVAPRELKQPKTKKKAAKVQNTSDSEEEDSISNISSPAKSDESSPPVKTKKRGPKKKDQNDENVQVKKGRGGKGAKTKTAKTQSKSAESESEDEQSVESSQEIRDSSSSQESLPTKGRGRSKSSDNKKSTKTGVNKAGKLSDRKALVNGTNKTSSKRTNVKSSDSEKSDSGNVRKRSAASSNESTPAKRAKSSPTKTKPAVTRKKLKEISDTESDSISSPKSSQKTVTRNSKQLKIEQFATKGIKRKARGRGKKIIGKNLLINFF